MTRFVHPATPDITLAGVLGALADPVRLAILKKLLKKWPRCLSCTEATIGAKLPKSTLSHHFRILRDAGLIRTEKVGVENRNSVRWDELNDRFPGLLTAIMKVADTARRAEEPRHRMPKRANSDPVRLKLRG